MQLPLPSLPRDDLDHAHATIGQRWERLRDKRVFLTGGTGFVGKWLLATLLDANERLRLGCQVTVLTRDPDAFRRQSPQLADAPGLQLIRGDVRTFELDSGPFSHIVHAATDVVATASPLDTFDTCVQGTRRVLDFAIRARADAVLLVSSGAVYGRQPTEVPALDEDFSGAPDPLKVKSAYSEGKRAAEWLASAYAAKHGVRVTTARCFAFVGPYLPLDKHFAIGNFLRDAMQQQPITIQGDGTPFRSYLHASDMAAWLWAILFEGRSQAAYNVGGIESVSIAQLAHRIVEALGSTSAIRVLKEPAAGAVPERYVPDVRRVQSELQLSEPWGLNEAILRTARWHQQAQLPS